MSPDTVLDALVIVLHARTEATRLRKVTSWTPAFEGASPEEPRLVHRLDQPGRYYYIVSFSMAAGTTARLRMNAYTGAYAEGIGIDKPGDVLPAYRTPPQSFQRLARALQADANKKKLKKWKMPAMTMEPFLAWKPCAQSFSAFLPFYVITVGGSQRYVRVDGRTYDALTFGAGL